MILDYANKWKPGDTLGVSFLNGSSKLHKRVEEAAKIWENYANIKFDFSGNSRDIIRIKFNAGKNDSKIGTDALTFKNDETIAFAGLHENSIEADLKQVVLHEFGHALGLIHEHFHPNSSINLDIKKTRKHFMNAYGFTEADVDKNLLREYCINQLSSSEFDPTSIMIYDIPSTCTTDGKEYNEPTELSEIDKQFIASIYPQEENPPEQLIPDNIVEFKINSLYDEKIYKFSVNPSEDKRYYIETTSTEDIALSLFRIEDEGDRRGYIDYLEPFDENNETIGKTAKIELEEYVINHKPNISEYFVRLRLKDALNTSGSIKRHSL